MIGYTESELNTFSKERLIQILLSQQEQINRLNDNMERLIRADSDYEQPPFLGAENRKSE